MKRETQEPLNYKIRDALIELKMRKFGGNKQVCTKANLLGVILMTKSYKSKRSIKIRQIDSSNQQNTDNEVRCQLFKRISNKTRKKSAGLQITKAVIHYHQNKRPRVTTERTLLQYEQKNVEIGRQLRVNGCSTRVLKSHRDNSSGKFIYVKANQKTQQDFRPNSAYTQVYRDLKSKKGGAKPFSMHMRFKTDYQILQPDIEGWNAQQPDQSYFVDKL